VFDIACRNFRCFRQLFRHDETLKKKTDENRHPKELLAKENHNVYFFQCH
jgi:hypothetical protein